jgi:hypothetical protein
MAKNNHASEILQLADINYPSNLLASTRRKVKLRKQTLIIVSLIAMKIGLIGCF